MGKKLNGMIPHFAAKISSHLPFLMNFSAEAVAAWIPNLISVIGHGFNTFDTFESSAAMSSFFPLMCSFMSQHGDYSGLPGFCDRDSNGEIIHYNVQCDGCKTSPIKGSPFMGLHEMMNQFGHGPHKWFGHHWKGRFCGKNRQRAQQQHVPQQHVPHNWWQHNQAHRGWRRYQNNNNNHNMYQQQGQYQWQQWCENRQNEQEPVISSNIANIKDAANKKIKVMADFVSDVTLPDRTYYPTDTVLTKTWKM